MDASSNKVTLSSPRLTPEYLRSLIVSEQYWYMEETRTTVCSVMLVNGFSITDSVVCTNADSYVPEVGERHALAKVLVEVRRFEYYLLKQRLLEESQRQGNCDD